MRHYPAGPGAPRLVLAHGAGAGERHPWMQRVGDGLASRGVAVTSFDFPYKQAGRSVPDAAPVLEDAFRDVWHETVSASPGTPAFFAGGKSMGGRISSQAQAAGKFAPPPGGLIFFGYPLHPPGKPAQRRDRHLPRVGIPMLFLHGTRDPFGSPDEMESLVASLPDATLHLVEGGDHSLNAPKSVDRRGESLERALDAAAAWIRSRGVPL
jgi:predicted alpha/beta-hydrolase family hydrolase